MDYFESRWRVALHPIGQTNERKQEHRWLGPAFRGVLARRLKQNHCRFQLGADERDWPPCQGCPHQLECAYGRRYEPRAPMDDSAIWAGQDPVRPIVISPARPELITEPVAEPESGRRAERWAGRHAEERGESRPRVRRASLRSADPHPPALVQLRVLTLGPAAEQDQAHVAEALAEGGRLGNNHQGWDFLVADVIHGRQVNLNPKHFGASSVFSGTPGHDLDGLHDTVRASRDELTAEPARDVKLEVLIELTSPLFLKIRNAKPDSRFAVPHLEDLLRASTRTLGQLFWQCGEPIDAEWKELFHLASQAQAVSEQWYPFNQVRSSARSGQRWSQQGFAGSARYSEVDARLLPWLIWGGRVHVGTHRVAGAGGWRVLVGQD